MKKMKFKYIIFCILAHLLIIINLYYVLCFTSTFKYILHDYIQGIYIGLVIDYLIIEQIKIIIKVILMRYSITSKYLMITYRIFLKIY